MKLTKPQMDELLDFINQVNEEDAHGTDFMQRSPFASVLGVALVRSLRYGAGLQGSAQADDLREEWQSSAPRYSLSDKYPHTS